MTTKQGYRQTVYRSPVGTVRLLTDGNAILAVGLNESAEDFEVRCKKVSAKWTNVEVHDDKLLKTAVDALDDFFNHKKPLPNDLFLSPQGTSFQQRVWKELMAVPPGETTTYGKIAVKMGSPGAARAVGSACGANPIPLFIPCHRVVGSSGDLRGFGGGGVEVKKQLLDLEKRQGEL